jgi:hypothetical protein
MRLLPVPTGVGNQKTGVAQSDAPVPIQALASTHTQMELEVWPTRLQSAAVQHQCKFLRLPAVSGRCAGLAELAM